MKYIWVDSLTNVKDGDFSWNNKEEAIRYMNNKISGYKAAIEKFKRQDIIFIYGLVLRKY